MFAELDVARRDRLAELVTDAEQVLVTAAVEADVPAVLAGTRLEVRDLVDRESVSEVRRPSEPPAKRRRAPDRPRSRTATPGSTWRAASPAPWPRDPGPPAPRRTGAGRSRRSRRVDPQASGAHPDDRDPQTLDATIGRFIAQQGWERDVRVHGVFSRWGAIVGDQVAQHAQPVSFVKDADTDGGRLVVQTDSTAWATQMRLLAPTVLTPAQRRAGGRAPSPSSRCAGPSAPRWSHGRRSVRGGRGPRDTYG